MKIQTLVILYIHNLKSINIGRYTIWSIAICHLQGHCNFSSVLMILPNVSSHWKLVKILVDMCRLWGVSVYIPEFQSFFWQFQACHLKETLFTEQKSVSFLANFNFKEPRNISRLTFYLTRSSGSGQHF